MVIAGWPLAEFGKNKSDIQGNFAKTIHLARAFAEGVPSLGTAAAGIATPAWCHMRGAHHHPELRRSPSSSLPAITWPRRSCRPSSLMLVALTDFGDAFAAAYRGGDRQATDTAREIYREFYSDR